MRARLSGLWVLMFFGCGGSTLSPPGGGDVTLDVAVSRVAGAPTVRAVVTNERSAAIRHGVGCSFWGPGMQVHFLDASGQKLLLGDSRAAEPACPDGIAVLEAGGRLEAATELAGILYTEDGDPVPMQPGEYSAVVSFGWRPVADPSVPWQALDERIELRWPVP